MDDSLAIIETYRGIFQDRLKLKLVKERNIGLVRNKGAELTRAPIIFHTNSDVLFPRYLLEDIWKIYAANTDLISLTGRTTPVSTSVLCSFCYGVFDLLRCLFSKAPFPIKKFRPGGSFISIRTPVFHSVKGFPNVRINEDGLLGYRIDDYLRIHKTSVKFAWNLHIYHYAKRFNTKGSIQTVLFYSYVVGNMLPFLKPFFSHIEKRSAETFVSRKDLI